MTPTPKLRWVRRGYDDDNKVLQQWWVKQVLNDNGEAFDTDVGAWRDVPLEEET